jgi:peptidoglycan/LPS O-acetylase OafA/YrhL
MSHASTNSLRRNLQLDILRGVAILMVLVCHSVLLRKPTWDETFWRAGWSGVDLFFVVSGFLISGLLFTEYCKTGGIQFRRFAIRRAIKIYPPFYALILLTVAVRLARHPVSLRTEIWEPLLYDVFFIQSYIEGTWGHFWSLSVEEHFYILLPLTMFYLIRSARRRNSADPFAAIPKMFILVAVSLLIVRLLTARYIPYSVQTHLVPTHLRLDSLLFGVLISYWHHFHNERFSSFTSRNRNLILCAAAILLSPAFFVSQYDQWMYTYGFASLYLGYGCLLVGFLHVPLNDIGQPIHLGLRAIAYIGTFSYSIYLWHLPWIHVLQQTPQGPIRSVQLLLFYAGSILVGTVTAKLVEFPALRLREHLFPRVEFSQPVEPLPTPVSSGKVTGLGNAS